MAANLRPGEDDNLMELASGLPLPHLLKCSVCFGSLERPRVLPCLHSFCERCLELHIHSHSPEIPPMSRTLLTPLPGKHSFPCPTCREVVQIPALGVQGFRHDFRAEQLRDFLNSDDLLQLVHKDKCITDDEKRCEFCAVDRLGENKKERTQFYCENCRRYLCGPCADKHISLPVFKKHVLAKTKGCKTVSAIPTVNRCHEHSRQMLNLFCLSCEKGVCSACSIVTHKDHNLTDLRTGLEGYQANATSLWEAMQDRLKQLRRVTHLLVRAEKRLKLVQKEKTEAIRDHADELVRTIRGHEKKILQDLADKCKVQTKGLYAMRAHLELAAVDIEDMLGFGKEVAFDGDLTLSMVPVYREFIGRMEHMLHSSSIKDIGNLETTCSFVPSKSKIKFGKLNWTNLSADSRTSKGTLARHMGSILFDISSNTSSDQSNLWTIKVIGKEGLGVSEFHMPKGLCFLPDGSIIVADTGNDRLQKIDRNGRHASVLCPGLVRPWAITTNNSCDTLYVADAIGKCITAVDLAGSVLRRFGKFLCPCGVAVTPTDDIWVADFFSPTIHSLSPDGAHLHQFDFRDDQDRHQSGTAHLAVAPSRNIIISDVSNNCVKIYSPGGIRLRRISQPSTGPQNYLRLSTVEAFSQSLPQRTCASLFCPQGVAVSGGRIFLVNASNCEVSVHTEQGDASTTRFPVQSENLRGLHGITVLPGEQKFALTDVLTHQVVLVSKRNLNTN